MEQLNLSDRKKKMIILVTTLILFIGISFAFITAQNADGTTVSGFDITTASGLYNIASDYIITSTSGVQATEQNLTFINLTTNQSENSGSALDAEIILNTEERYTLANYITNVVYTGTDGNNGLYYHDGSVDYNMNSCIYNGNPVISYDTWEYESVTEESCQKVYQAVYYDGDVQTIEYFDATMDYYYYNEPVAVEWDSEAGTCITTTDGSQVYEWDGDYATESQCTGLAYQWENDDYLKLA